MEDLGTLKEQHREQKLFPQLLQLRLFFSTEKVAEQPVQFPDKQRQQLSLKLAQGSELTCSWLFYGTTQDASPAQSWLGAVSKGAKSRAPGGLSRLSICLRLSS